MADQRLLEILRQGPEAWNRLREQSHEFLLDLSMANFSGVDLRGAEFGSADFRGHVNLERAILSRTDLRGVDLKGASLNGAYLRDAYLSRANLERACLSQADLSGADLNGACLRDANLSRAKLENTKVTEADLCHAWLDAAELRLANFRGSKLKGAHLIRADLHRAELENADLSGANLSGAKLGHANLSGTNLDGADLSETILGETLLVNTNLRTAKGLDTTVHYGPSVIDHRTLAQSGRLPLAFLRGCGLPDRLIDYLPSLLNEAIRFYSCFISYSTADQEFAERLHADLQNKGVRCWFARHDIQGGKKIHEQIDEAIRLYDRLLLILSEASMNSEWVKTEIAHARQKEISQARRALFPISLVQFSKLRNWKCFDADTGKDSAREIREYHVPDFSRWKDHDAYHREFERLLRDLRAEESEVISR